MKNIYNYMLLYKNCYGVDENLTIGAAKLKLKYHSVLSLADCYLIALAKRYGAIIVTTDHNIKEVKEASTILLESL
ncbi:MAG: PIN domain-containing protein [Thermoprotei archaeon]|nr:PIN domain-containing protein [Thermoprotei archaeon]